MNLSRSKRMMRPQILIMKFRSCPMTTRPAQTSPAIRRTWSIMASDSASLTPDVGSTRRRTNGATATERSNSRRRDVLQSYSLAQRARTFHQPEASRNPHTSGFARCRRVAAADRANTSTFSYTVKTLKRCPSCFPTGHLESPELHLPADGDWLTR